MKILACHPGAELYGADRMFAVSTHILLERGAEVTAALPLDGPLVALLEESALSTYTIAVPVLRKASMTGLGVFRLAMQTPLALYRCIRAISKFKADLVYVNTLTQPWWIFAARLSRKRVVVHVREAETEGPKIVHKLLICPTKFAHVVICNSQHTRLFVLDSGGRRNRSKVIYNGKEWLADERPARAPLAEERPVTLLLLGRISPRKGTDLAIAATRILLDQGFDIRLRLVGSSYSGYEWYLDEMHSLCRRLQLQEVVSFLGHSDNPGTELASCDIAIVPSRVEPFGSVAAEAMAYGRPTVVADIDGLREIVSDSTVGYTFSVDSSEDLARKCEQVISNPVDARRIGANAKNHILANFSIDKYRSQLVDAICEAQGVLDLRGKP